MSAIKVIICLWILWGLTIPESLSAKGSRYQLSKFSWLLGSWEMETKNGTIIESWHFVNDSTLGGISYKITLQGDTIPQENIQLIYKNNSYSYIPTTADQNDQQPVVFTITRFDKRTFIAENTEHDFPQKITYELKNKSELYAMIDGNIDGQYNKQEYLMQRVQ